MEMLAPGGLPVSQAPPSHLHPHAAAMMQHAAAAHSAGGQFYEFLLRSGLSYDK